MAESKAAVKLVIYPYENRTYLVPAGNGYVKVYAGALYVVNGSQEMISIVAGPTPENTFADRGGHSADSTPAGHYVLDKTETHTTMNWPSSVVPWGAPVREQNGIIQYKIGSQWRDATGPRGTVTQSLRMFIAKTPDMHPTPQEMEQMMRNMFIDRKTGTLATTYQSNDFGKLSWNLKHKGRRTAYYIHTTPVDEYATANGQNVMLMQSHGCIHIRPADRDLLMKKGYLREGIAVEIKKYGEVGPPPGFMTGTK